MKYTAYLLGFILMASYTTACQSKKGPETASGLRKIHFDFDSASIRPDMVAVLDSNARYLNKKSTKKISIVIEGHCDERGTNEYNLALGDRRADITRDYLVKQGVAEKRVKTVSYGEERPLDQGHGESSWYKNRRAEFLKQ